MAQWINVLGNSSFINLSQLLFCGKNWSRSPSTTGSYSRLADEMLLHLEIFRISYICWTKNWKFISVQKGSVIIVVLIHFR